MSEMPIDSLNTQQIEILLNQPQIDRGAHVLAGAFQDDPFFIYCLPDADKRSHVLLWFYERYLRYSQRTGRIYTTSSFDGIAIWFGPSNLDLHWMGILLTGLFLLPLKLSRQEFSRCMEMQHCADRLHDGIISGPHWYLSELAVDPSRQGQGVGRALIQPMLAQAEREGLPCYLETNKERNVLFYQRNGFQVAGRDQASPQSPPTWALLRKPG